MLTVECRNDDGEELDCTWPKCSCTLVEDTLDYDFFGGAFDTEEYFDGDDDDYDDDLFLPPEDV